MLHHHSQGNFFGIFNSSQKFWQVITERFIQRQTFVIYQFGDSNSII